MQGSFVRKRGTTWTAYFYVADMAGTRRQRSKGGFRTKVEAQQFLAGKVTAVRRGEHIEANRITLSTYINDQWLPLVARSVQPTTFHSYQQMLRLYVLPTLGGIHLQQLDHSHLDKLYTELLDHGRQDHSRGLSPKTVRYLHNTIHKLLKDAQRKHLVFRNVAEAADPPKVGGALSDSIKTWNSQQVRMFLEGTTEHPLHTAFILAATTGMRRGEVLGVRWQDIDFDNKRLAVRKTITHAGYKMVFGGPKTPRARRLIALDTTTVEALQQHRRRQEEIKGAVGDRYVDQDWVFAREDGAPTHPDYMSQSFGRNVKRLGLPKICLHDLRHTHATLGLTAGIPGKVVSERLGHSTVAFTLDVYTHAVPQMQEDAADLVANLIFGSKPDNG